MCFAKHLLIAVSGAAGRLNDGNSRKRRSYHACVWGIVPKNIRSSSVYLSKNFPESHLSGNSHEVVLMDDRAHAGLFMRHFVEPAAKGGSRVAILLPPSCWRLIRLCKSRRIERP
jgi:hypothetical protein